MKYLLISFVVALVYTSCDSDNESDLFSGTYNSRSLQIEGVRLFTSNGEINDKNSINAFIHHHSNNQSLNYDSIVNASFIMNIDSIIDVSGVERIEFLANNKVVFTINDQAETRTMKPIGDVLYFEEELISTVNGDLNNSNSIFNQIYNYKPLYSKSTLVPNGSNFGSYITEFKACYYAVGSDLEIKVPIISYKYADYYGDTHLSTGIRSNVNNKFNESSISLIGINDTLAVQQFYMVLKK